MEKAIKEAMASSLRHVVSGKTLPAVSKDRLVEGSLYYRALLEGTYKDSHKPVYRFFGWSTKAFELLLQYIVTGSVKLKGLKLDVIRAALEMAEYLVVDGFKVELSRTLITSWTDLDAASAFQLAEELDVMESLREYSFIKVLNAVELEQHFKLQRLNFDTLILVTGMDSFWNYHKDYLESYEERWDRVIRRYRDILDLAVKLPPNSFKTVSLTNNLRIHWFNGQHRDMVLQLVDGCNPVSRCLTTGFEEHLVVTRQNLRRIFSHVRIPFDRGMKGRGVLEFNMNNWCWEVEEYRDKLEGYQCVMNRNYATFLCETGLFVIRKRHRLPKILRNERLEELVFRSYPELSCCVSGKFIFLLDYSVADEIPVLYKYDVFSNEFSTCTTVPVVRAKLKGHGDILYIAGYSVNLLEEVSVFCVMEYNVKTNEVSVVVRSSDFGFSVEDFLVVKRKLYVFSNEAFTTVDTLQKEDQELTTNAYTGFFRDMWDFELLDLTHTSDDTYLFLKVSNDYWYSFHLMVAHFNPVSSEITCLGFIPKVSVEEYFLFQCFGKFKSQIELRRPKDGTPCNTQEIMKELKRFY